MPSQSSRDLDTHIEVHHAPFADAGAELDQIPGGLVPPAAMILAKVGQDTSRLQTPAHPSPWARFAPFVKESAGRKKARAQPVMGTAT
jgi:transposase